MVMSAAVGVYGSRPSPEAVDVMRRMGVDLTQHESQPLTAQLIRHADTV
jgi:protein-tyrosine-phosphatase